ncbi:MAG: hypothetical protein LBD42_00230 [Desulfovibrio sp.]|nr:hypothetical protein [Desulfovibrio sp.]
MIISFRLLLCCLAVSLFASCASDGNFKNPFVDLEPVSVAPYYFSEFSDIPIPNDMSEERNETFITFAPSGVKCGTQNFSGRLELVSLMNAVRRNMASNDWILRSVLRAREATLVFEKTDRIATFHFTDGAIFTGMRLAVSSRLDGDSGSISMNAYPAARAATSQQTLAQ